MHHTVIPVSKIIFVAALVSHFAQLSDRAWRLFDAGYYQKADYEVRLPDGRTFIAWPNAGFMCTKIGSFGASDRVLVRKLAPHLQYGRYLRYGPQRPHQDKK